MSGLSNQFPAHNFTLIALVLALPLLGAIFNGLFGKRIGKDAVRSMALWAIGGSFVASVTTFLMVASADPLPGQKMVRFTWNAWHWFDVADRFRQTVPIDVAFSVDALSATMMLVVTGVGWLIHLYSTGYMADDPGFHRFFAYLNLFIFSMLVLILGDNMVVLFVGWEGVGLCSYLLIGFWFDDEKKAAAGKKAFITNRIGDFGLLVAMAMLIFYVGDVSWAGLETGAGRLVDARTVWPVGNFHNSALPTFVADLLTPDSPVKVTAVTLVALALFVGCMGKSAQVPLYVWLPDAMAGPTPVSALIHAATMVTAGVYLVARTWFIFALSPFAMAVVMGIGAFTALLAASIALTQFDLKKVLAYSTVSQLGFMFIGVGSGAFAAGFFHVLTHAFFKGCLFLCAGSVIHMMHTRIHDEVGSQDMRKMGGLMKYMPFTHATFLVSCIAIAGIPPLSGFWSKDELLLKAYINKITPPNPAMWTAPDWYGPLIYTVGLLAAVCTAFYMFRAYFMTFHGSFRGWTPVAGFTAPAHHDDHHDEHGHEHGDEPIDGPVPHESPYSMTVPLMVLAALAAVAGFLYAEPLHIAPLEHFLAPVFSTMRGDELVLTPMVTERVPHGDYMGPLLIVGTLVAFGGAGAAWWVYMSQGGEPARKVATAAGPLYRLVYDKWRVDELYEATVLGIVDAMGDSAALIDRWLFDGIIAKLTAALAQGFGAALRLLQTGRVQVYAAGMVVGTAAVGWFLFAPHANAKVDNSGLANGKLILSAAPGHGYKYRWHLDGQKAPEGFDGPTRYVVNLTPCETRVVHLGVQNVFGRIDEREFTQCRETTPGCCRAPTGESGGTTAAIPTGRLPAEQHKKLVGPNRKGRKAGAAPSPSARRPAVPRPSALRPSALRPSAPRPSAPRPSAPRPSTPKAVTK